MGNRLLMLIHKNYSEAIAEALSYPKSKVEYVGFNGRFFEFLMVPEVYYQF